MNYLLAISGGVDSVVLLDIFSQRKHPSVVAHVDHGIRGEESAADARFVEALAKQYNLPFVSIALHLPADASEEQARNARYEFLFNEAKKYKATVVTAHHRDDAVETVALNITRGTGWRGLAVLNREGIHRPLIELTKQQLYTYAIKQRLEWVEDATNTQDVYLRNRLRRKINSSDIDGSSMMALRAKQLQLRHDIDKEVDRLTMTHYGSRYFMKMIPDDVALELLGAEIAKVAPRPTRPRLVRAVHAVKTAPAGSMHQVGDGVLLHFTTRNYTVSVV